MTAPLGYLKRNFSTFIPPLPSRLTAAINNISYGRLEKIYVTFPSAFWDGPASTLSAESANANPASSYPFFTHFLPPTYSPFNPHAYNIECASLSALPLSTAHPTLLFYIHGPCASHVLSLISHLHPSSPLYASQLNNFFHPYYSRLPGYKEGDVECMPKGWLATRWQEDEMAGWGSYSNFQVSGTGEGGQGEVDLAADIEALRLGMPDRGIWFAGEHTAPFVALGTVTGAWWSGEAVGGRIAALYGKGDIDAGEGVDGGLKGESLGTENGNRKMKAPHAKGIDGGSANGMAL